MRHRLHETTIVASLLCLTIWGCGKAPTSTAHSELPPLDGTPVRGEPPSPVVPGAPTNPGVAEGDTRSGPNFAPNNLSPPRLTPSGPSRIAPAQDPDERAMLRLINAHRVAHDLRPLRLSRTLVTASRWMSQDMARHNYLNHTDSRGRNSFVRMDTYGYEGQGWRGENIACGNDDAAATFRQWLHSPGHNANMLNPRYNLIGIARAYDASSRYGWYWTTDFGSE